MTTKTKTPKQSTPHKLCVGLWLAGLSENNRHDFKHLIDFYPEVKADFF